MITTKLPKSSVLALLAAGMTAAAAPAAAQSFEAACAAPVGRIASVEGGVERRIADGSWRAARIEEPLCAGDMVRTGKYSRAAIALANDSVLRLDQETTLQVGAVPAEEPSVLDLIKGIMQVFSHRPRSLSINTPFVNASVEGTEFLVLAEADRAAVTVFDGKVRASNAQGAVVLAAAGTAEARAGAAPVQGVAVRPRDAAHWTLYYQPIVTEVTAAPAAGPGDLPPAIADALELRRRGDFAGAIARLDAAAGGPAPDRIALFRQSLLLEVGRVEEARAGVEAMLSRAPGNADALALRSVIRVAQNETEPALADGRRAVDLAPRSAPARIALSYAQQAALDLEAARATLEEAVAANPGDALARARLAEILMTLGYRSEAERSARAAAELAPDLGRAQTVLGFAALVRQDPGGAQAAFERAVRLEPADPQPRLGLGLALIRQGHLEAGRNEIEIAAGLDTGNALVRSYLGRGYDEERRDDRAAGQYEIAKQLDPKDPTPFLFEGLRLRAANQPVEALAEIQRSIELNDNRAPFRSRLLLNEDLATRGAGLGRIYRDLGFERLGLPVGSASLAADPGSASVERFLSDLYGQQERHEIARSSALLRSQLLQPITIDPVQPSLSTTDLQILPGALPSEAGFNEYGALFERDQIRLNAAGVIGNLDTRADELTLSGIVGRAAFSAGQFHYQSDGYRENNDVEYDIYTLFGQAALTDTLSLQAELRSRRSEQGDLAQNFDPDDFSRDSRTDIDQDTARVGLRYSPTPRVDLLASVIVSDRESSQVQAEDEFTFTDDIKQTGSDTQVQGIYRGDLFNVTAGGGFASIRQRNVATLDIPALGQSFPTTERFTNRQTNAYGYVNLTPLRDVTVTLGLSGDKFENGVLDFSEVNPKAGIQWQVNDRLRLRAAAFRTFKRLLIVDQTLEPTQIAGFNQFTDEFNQTSAWVKGIGLDATLARGGFGSLFGGVEYTRRDLDVPLVVQRDPPEYRTDERTEDEARGYLYWAASRDWAVSAEAQWQDIDNTNQQVDIAELRTLTVPVQVRYFADNGLFARVGANFVSQQVEERLPQSFDQTRENFVTVDAALGFRLPNRRGSISLEVRNILDEEFLYQDLDSITNSLTRPRFIPARTVLGRISLTF
ncbi:TonB-dependent receptor [Skermanella rosea]|uniref:TonB-dependent receptor domain-containing protein n=1 Tax=Skermanella rosea TaxID=1817965 RepID=UPI00193131F9|nr:TonB-dependent receptor [Skermanella rosea]UEM04716.1 TonB-dependent receptor [Skermanella rosea]